MTDLHLDWSTAEVRGGKLNVPLDDKPTREWSASFEKTERLLGRGDWKVKLKKREVVVSEVEPGSEERLRFFLESLVQEANAEVADDEDDERDDAAGEAEDEAGSDDENDPDAEMTDRFRSFAGASESDGKAAGSRE